MPTAAVMPLGNDSVADAMASCALPVGPLDETRKLGEGRRRRSHVRRHCGIREQREQRINVGRSDLTKRRQVAMQGPHWVRPSVEHRVTDISGSQHVSREPRVLRTGAVPESVDMVAPAITAASESPGPAPRRRPALRRGRRTSRRRAHDESLPSIEPDARRSRDRLHALDRTP